MRLAVLTHQPGPVHREHHGQALDRHVVDDVVIAALQEGRVDRHHRTDARGREARGEGHAMPFGDADVEHARGVRLGDRAGARSARHRCRDGDDFGPGVHDFGEPLAEHGRVVGVPARRLDLLPRCRVVAGREGVPLLAMLPGGESLALLGDHVHETRTLHLPHVAQRVDQLDRVVAIDRTEVPEAKLFEEHAGGQERLDALLPLPHECTEHRLLVHDAADLRAQPVVDRVALHLCQVLVHRPDVGRDRHLVVVEDDDDVRAAGAGIVEPLVREATRQGAVADDRDHLVRTPLEVSPERHTDGRRDGGGRVPGAKRVVFALGTLEEPRQPALLTQRVEPASAPGEHLVRVALVPHVPDQLVLGRVEHEVQRNGQLDDTQAGPDVPAGDGTGLDQEVAHLLRELRQLLARDLLEAGGKIGAIEQGHETHGG